MGWRWIDGRKVLWLACAGLWAGCQTAEGPTQASREPDYQGYQAEAIALKGRVSFQEYEARLPELRSRHGIPAPEAPESAAPAAAPLAKAASEEVVYTTATSWANAYRKVFQVHKGDHFNLQAKSVNGSDPVGVLIQFNNDQFKLNGSVPYSPQVDFKILAYADDAAPGDFSANIGWDAPDGVTGYVQWVVMPFSGTSSGNVTLRIDQWNNLCPNCDYIWQEYPLTTRLYGTVYGGKAGNKFSVVPQSGDPVLYAFKVSAMTGYYCDDCLPNNGSEIYAPPFRFSPVDAQDLRNRVLISGFGGSGSGTYTLSSVAPSAGP